ncbi:hypothetical protein QWZ13_09745 [Reinekea marina]|nr:hypothetical protein [Reinekea marina]MDN3649193.1 hypothetical protein [Reinekea marina]
MTKFGKLLHSLSAFQLLNVQNCAKTKTSATPYLRGIFEHP